MAVGENSTIDDKSMGESVELCLTGMTCSSCAARIEKRLNRLDGASANVNFATEKASVSFDSSLLTTQDLLDAISGIGYGASLIEGNDRSSGEIDDESRYLDHLNPLRNRLIISAILSLPVLALSMVPSLEFQYWQWVALALATPVFIYGGLPFHKAAIANARHLTSSMDTLVSLGSLAAYLWSLYALIFTDAGGPSFRMMFSLTASINSHHPDIYLETASVVITVILFGRYLEAKGKRRSTSVLRSLLLGNGQVVHKILNNDIEVEIDVVDLRPGDRFSVRSGEKVPTDGEIESGEALLDLALLTGEYEPKRFKSGMEVVGGSLNVDGFLVVRATKVGSDTALAGIVSMVEEAQAKKAKVQAIADKVSGIFVPSVIAIAIATFLFRVIIGDSIALSFSSAIAVLVIACPCALGLATPMAILVGTSRAAQMGILIRGPEALEAAGKIDTVVVDKTGTLTTGTMTLQEILLEVGFDYDFVLSMAASAEAATTHPIGRFIVSLSEERELEVQKADLFKSYVGSGVMAQVAGHSVAIGKLDFCLSSGFEISTSFQSKVDAYISNVSITTGLSRIYIGLDGIVVAFMAIGDEIRDDAFETLKKMRQSNLDVVLLSGDNQESARITASQLGIERVVAGATPSEKADYIRELQSQGARVAMIGDGINDAAALAQADLGVAMGSGSAIAQESGDITVFLGGVSGAYSAILVARATLRTIHTNLFWAFAYNVAAIPIAMAGLINPVIAGSAMAFSSVFVVGNSLRLFGFMRR